ncbi:MAG: hypothetical protein F4101_04565 [Nitrospira sp. SB0673_bin_12]|nr:hypothetical protein [Nitrospira sp. SB0673_bin_12]
MAPPDPPVRNVSASRLRQLFNESQYPELIRHNLLKREVIKSRPLDAKALLETGFPAGTLTETITYSDSARKMYYLKIHQYVLPDGTLGGSGMPDPKVIWLGGIAYCMESPSRAAG